MTITLHTWSTSDKPALISLCNVVDRTFLSDLLPNPYTEVDADWWLGMVVENDGKEGIWRSIWAGNYDLKWFTRGGVLRVRLEGKRVFITGHAVLFMKGEIPFDL